MMPRSLPPPPVRISCLPSMQGLAKCLAACRLERCLAGSPWKTRKTARRPKLGSTTLSRTRFPVVDVSDPADPQIGGFVRLDDPTHKQVKLGRTWFNDADASTTGTFSCASCHPDGHTDQLLWVLKTPVVSGGNQIMPRSTMPIRGLRDTEPYHWDGVPGDPYGGNNSANIHGSSPPNSDVDDPASSTRHLIDGGLATTMHLDGDKTINDEGKAGKLSAAERDDMALFLLSVPYPPAQRRAFDNVLSEEAEQGFKLFHIEGDLDPSKPRPNVCGNCHRMPFLVSTNTPGTGMDAPTWRGAYDRFLILPQGRLNIIDFDFYRRVAERGQSEEDIWRFLLGRPPPLQSRLENGRRRQHGLLRGLRPASHAQQGNGQRSTHGRSPGCPGTSRAGRCNRAESRRRITDRKQANSLSRYGLTIMDRASTCKKRASGIHTAGRNLSRWHRKENSSLHSRQGTGRTRTSRNRSPRSGRSGRSKSSEAGRSFQFYTEAERA